MKHGQKGFSLMELIVVMGIIGTMIAVAAPATNRKAMSLPLASEELQGALRIARANSMRHGAHFRLTITSAQTYTIQRMQDPDGDGIWAVDSAYPVQTTTLSPSVSIGSSAVGQRIEFNSRGLLHSTVAGILPSVVYVPLSVIGGNTKTVEIWPSGQVEES
jgi:prepilin-type N-terminal cleavage/methylation domain-containing protein